MAKALYYPPANRTAQWYADNFPGIIWTSARVLVLHTTETSGWPGYGGGASMPHFTAMPDYANKRINWRQHAPLNMSVRTLRNDAGGVQTNNSGAIQIELVGTSDRGGPGMFWPEAPDWALQDLADFILWLQKEWGVPAKSTVTWRAYPASYGFNASQRLSGNEWLNYRGVLGHQHVPENDHGDPGNLPWARLTRFFTPVEEDLPLNDADKKFIKDTVTAQVRTLWQMAWPEYYDKDRDGVRDPMTAIDALFSTYSVAANTGAVELQKLTELAAKVALLETNLGAVHANQVEILKALRALTPTQPTV